MILIIVPDPSNQYLTSSDLSMVDTGGHMVTTYQNGRRDFPGIKAWQFSGTITDRGCWWGFFHCKQLLNLMVQLKLYIYTTWWIWSKCLYWCLWLNQLFSVANSIPENSVVYSGHHILWFCSQKELKPGILYGYILVNHHNDKYF